MYAFIEGKVCEKGLNELVLMAGSVGYRIMCSMNTLQAAPAVGETMRCHTILSVREDAMELYGFSSAEEKLMFRQLTAISGVGPKMALAILGTMSLRDLRLAIVLEDITAICRAPGVGKKTAQRIALELKDKISQDDMSAPAVPAVSGGKTAAAASDNVAEAIEALIALGYSAQEARSAVGKLPDRSGSADELIRLALRSMAGM